MVIAKYFCFTFRSTAQCQFTEPLMVVVVYMQNHWRLWLFTKYRATDCCGWVHTKLVVVVVYIQSHWWWLLLFTYGAWWLWLFPYRTWWLWLFPYGATDGCGCFHTEPLIVVVVYIQSHWWLWLFLYRATDGCGCLHAEPLVVVIVYIQSHWWL